MGRFIVIVLDGLGIGAMEDVRRVRPQDVGADTFFHIYQNYPDMAIPNLVALGILDAYGIPQKMTVCQYGRAKLAHFGADTFYGHQEIMGSKPVLPKTEPLSKYIIQIKETLEDAGYKVVEHGMNKQFLIVNQAMTVADNIECDLGSAINVTGCLDLIDFETIKKVGKLVRACVKVPRVIAFGGEGVSLEDLLNSQEIKGDYIGINAPKSGVYQKNYQCIHLGYGVDPSVQVPTLLAKKQIKTYLVGKVADIVDNPYGESHPCVDTHQVFKTTLNLLNQVKKGFICVNVQETDLSGHSQDTLRYKQILEIADHYIGQIKERLNEEDCMIIMADHGNDPTIGHSKHTREYVPILLYQPNNLTKRKIEDRETLADVGATVLAYFGIVDS